MLLGDPGAGKTSEFRRECRDLEAGLSNEEARKNPVIVLDLTEPDSQSRASDPEGFAD